MRTLISFLILATTICGAAEARRANDVTTTYYSNAAKTTEVGFVEYTCGGGIVRSGRVTKFLTRTSDSCLLRRIDGKAMKRMSSARGRLSRSEVCHAMCYRKFGTPAYCLPDGSCPQADALQECNQTCDASPDNQ